MSLSKLTAFSLAFIFAVSPAIAARPPLPPALLQSGPTTIKARPGERVVMWATWAEATDWTTTGVPEYIYPSLFDMVIDGVSYVLSVGPFEGSAPGATTADFASGAEERSGWGVPTWGDSRGNYGVVSFDSSSATPSLAYDYTFTTGTSRTLGWNEMPATRFRFYWPDDNVKLDGVVERISADGKQVLARGTYHGRRFGTGGGLTEYAKVTWFKNGQKIVRHDLFGGDSPDWFDIPSYTSADAGTYLMRVENSLGKVDVTFQISTSSAPTFSLHPASQSAPLGGTVTLSATSSAGASLQWQYNGTDIAGATSSILVLSNLQVANAGVYTAVASAAGELTTSSAAVVGITISEKSAGAGLVVDSDVRHPNGNIYDQVMLTGSAAAVTADYNVNQITRTSFIDVDNDIVQVEMSGPGTLSIVLAGAGDPAFPVNYKQAVKYVKGHPGIVITGANENTNVSIFSVGRATAFDPTGGYNIALPAGPTNLPSNNHSPLFDGHASTAYDGTADVAFVAISSTNGKFGGVRTANTTYFASKGITGLYAPGVQFVGPVYLGDVNAFDAAVAVIQIGSCADVRVTGGDLWQANGKPVQLSGISKIKFTPGADSHGNEVSAKPNQSVLMQGGSDVTAQVVVNP